MNKKFANAEEFIKLLLKRLDKFEKETIKEHIEFMDDRDDDLDMDDIEPCDDRENTLWEQGQRKGIEQTIQLINEMITKK